MAGVLVDLGPLKRYRDLRFLSGGQLALFLANQIVQTAVPYEHPEHEGLRLLDLWDVASRQPNVDQAELSD